MENSRRRRAAGKLTTSSDLVNQMWKIGLWGQRGNFLSVPTDCPQRDERLGWMGDAGVFWRTGAYNYDIAAFTHKWMNDVVDAQTPAGAFTNTVPDLGLGVGLEGAPGWGDAGIILPWTTWRHYGDVSVINDYWDAMERWMKFIQTANPDFVRTKGVGPSFGDWLAPNSKTPNELIATAYWAWNADMMAQMARATNRTEDAERYSEIFNNIRAAFQKTFVKPNGEVGSGSQTSYVLALKMKLLPDSMVTSAVENLVKDIDAHEGHLTTGFLGTPHLLFVLAENGRADVAYKLLLTETYPSWGYMLKKGATTWWERWNGDTGDPAMNSFNHYAFGSVVAWVYQSVAGIDTDPDAPGFKKISIRPITGGPITQARGEYDSVYGKIVSDWKAAPDGTFSIRVTIPPNTTAKVYLPAKPGGRITESGRAVEAQKGPENTVIASVGSGSYEFHVN
jgi:alpha-L-rhamnosidase